jgi:hypothetical protein
MDKGKVIRYIGKTLLKGLKMALNGFIRISLAIYALICALFLSYFICGFKRDAQKCKNVQKT